MRKLLILTTLMILAVPAIGCQSCFPHLFRGEPANPCQPTCAPAYSAPCDSGCSTCAGMPTVGPATQTYVPGPAPGP